MRVVEDTRENVCGNVITKDEEGVLKEAWRLIIFGSENYF